MKLSDLELGIYDLTAIVLPGGIAIFECLVCGRGFNAAWTTLSKQSVASWVIFTGFSFVSGQLISQAAFETAKFRDNRFHKRTRDAAWHARQAGICSFLKQKVGIEIDPQTTDSCDRAFNLCLGLSGTKFEKRQNFTAISALMLSLWLLSITCAVIVAFRSLSGATTPFTWHSVPIAVTECIGLLIAALLSWRRSQLYFHLSDISVFDLAETSANESPVSPQSSDSSSEDE